MVSKVNFSQPHAPKSAKQNSNGSAKKQDQIDSSPQGRSGNEVTAARKGRERAIISMSIRSSQGSDNSAAASQSSAIEIDKNLLDRVKDELLVKSENKTNPFEELAKFLKNSNPDLVKNEKHKIDSLFIAEERDRQSHNAFGVSYDNNKRLDAGYDSGGWAKSKPPKLRAAISDGDSAFIQQYGKLLEFASSDIRTQVLKRAASGLENAFEKLSNTKATEKDRQYARDAASAYMKLIDSCKPDTIKERKELLTEIRKSQKASGTKFMRQFAANTKAYRSLKLNETALLKEYKDLKNKLKS
jgi:hypothetical protein